MNAIHPLPVSLIEGLAAIPAHAPVALLLRHSVRPPLPEDGAGLDLALTPRGFEMAHTLGVQLGKRLQTLRTSPVQRCQQTAEAMREGAGVSLPVEDDPMLGGLGAFLVDSSAAWKTFQERGHVAIMEHLVRDGSPLPGFAAADQAMRGLVEHMLQAAGEAGGLHVHITHDLFLAVTAARALGVELEEDDWPDMLEGAFFWRVGDRLHVRYRNFETSRPWPPTFADDTPPS